jgi:hypothetical protein
MARILSGGRRDAKLGTTPSGKAVWLEKHPTEYKRWSPSDHLYAAVLHEANRTRGGEIARLHRSLAQGAAKLTSHATKRAIPGVSKWDMTAGGTGAAEGKHGYTLTMPEGTYRIWPYTTKHGRHAGYMLKFSAEGGGRPRGSHGGLWHDLGSHASPQKAASAASAHYARGFE